MKHSLKKLKKKDPYKSIGAQNLKKLNFIYKLDKYHKNKLGLQEFYNQ